MSRNQTSKSRSSGGFTLIELLVVIAIIAILAAILFPVFASAREKARQTTCASNEKQLGLAFLQYEQDYDETFEEPTNSASLIGWVYPIYTYVKSDAVFDCPDDTFKTASAGYFPVSYAPNPWLTGSTNTNYNPNPIVANQLNSPALTVELVEVTGSQGSINSPTADYSAMTDCKTGFGSMYGSAVGYIGGTEYTSGQTIVGGTTNGYHAPRHTAGANFLAFDGHVKYLIGTQVSPGRAVRIPGSGCDSYSTTPEAATGCANAAGTASMTNVAGTTQFTMTFSPF
jgi:prepilin-type N-terminal cleavage/methylation domain-containing protein/prepilin-type processing-associated H-X9-DG protein